MASANVDGMVEAAIRSYRSGNKAEARQLLERATQLNQYNEQAWLWLSAVVETPEDQRICLENVLIVNPNNENARRGLNMLSTSPKPKTSPSSPETSAVLDTSDEDDWGIRPTATSSPSAVYNPASELSENEYDDWVSGLNLGGGKAETPPTSPQGGQVFEASVLDESTYANVFSGAFDDEFDDENVFAESVPSSSSMMSHSNLDDLRQAAFSDDQFDDPFEDDDEDIFGTDTGMSTSGPFTSSTLAYDISKDVSSSTSEASRSRSPLKESPSSPTTERGSSRKSGGSAFVNDRGFDSGAEPDPGVYFKAIPKQIKATRAPGTNESYPSSLMISLVALVVLNLGAFALLLLNV